MNERKKRVRRLRLLSMTAVLGVLTAGIIFGLGTGTLSAAGIKKDLFGLSVGIFVNSSCIAGYSVSFVYLFSGGRWYHDFGGKNILRLGLSGAPFAESDKKQNR